MSVLWRIGWFAPSRDPGHGVYQETRETDKSSQVHISQGREGFTYWIGHACVRHDVADLRQRIVSGTGRNPDTTAYTGEGDNGVVMKRQTLSFLRVRTISARDAFSPPFVRIRQNTLSSAYKPACIEIPNGQTRDTHPPRRDRGPPPGPPHDTL